MERIISLVLRAAELAFAAIVAGINGKIIDDTSDAGADAWDLGRFIYAEVVAGVAVFLALIWLIPFSATFTHWHLDVFVSLCWWAAFGLLVDVSLFRSVFLFSPFFSSSFFWLHCWAALVRRFEF